jgi:hypothetical protein
VLPAVNTIDVGFATAFHIGMDRISLKLQWENSLGLLHTSHGQQVPVTSWAAVVGYQIFNDLRLTGK